MLKIEKSISSKAKFIHYTCHVTCVKITTQTGSAPRVRTTSNSENKFAQIGIAQVYYISSDNAPKFGQNKNELYDGILVSS